MNHKRFLTAVFVAALIVGFLWGGLALGQGASFLIEGADQTRYQSLTPSFTLNGFFDALGSHFVVDNADSLRHAPLVFPWGLQGALDGLPVHFTVDMADANRFHALAYPKTLIGDATPPQEAGAPTVFPAGGGSVKIRWQTNEFSRGVVEYGPQPGQYTRSVAEPLYVKEHEVTLTGLPAEGVTYYRLTLTDPAGNTRRGPERSFSAAPGSKIVFLPLTIQR
jgi:hypothetical protein